MNTVRILICATFALLIAALVYTKVEPKEKTLSELREELEKVRLENQIKRERAAANPADYSQYNAGNPYAQPANNANPAPVAPPANFVNPLAPTDPADPVTTIDPSVTAKIEELKAENARLKEEQSKQEVENNLLNEEAGLIKNELTAKNKTEETRAAEIAQALVMARVKIYDPKSGIIVLDLERAENLVTGQVLGIRRGSAGGIIGRIKMGNIESSELGYADPIVESFFGNPVDVQVGDEIIVIP